MRSVSLIMFFWRARCVRALPVNSFRTVAVEAKQLKIVFRPAAGPQACPGVLSGSSIRFIGPSVNVVEGQELRAGFTAAGAFATVSGDAFKLRCPLSCAFLFCERSAVVLPVLFLIALD